MAIKHSLIRLNWDTAMKVTAPLYRGIKSLVIQLLFMYPQMSGLYSKILDRLDKAKKNVNMKE